jgi:hypothetical protein
MYQVCDESAPRDLDGDNSTRWQNAPNHNDCNAQQVCPLQHNYLSSGPSCKLRSTAGWHRQGPFERSAGSNALF